MEEKYYTLEDIMAITKLSERTIRRYIASGKLKGFKVGGEWRFTQKHLENLFEEKNFHKDIAAQAGKEVNDFLRRANVQHEDVRGCSVFDFKNLSKKQHAAIRLIVSRIPSKHHGITMKLYPEGDTLRISMVGGIDYLQEMTHELYKVVQAND